MPCVLTPICQYSSRDHRIEQCPMRELKCAENSFSKGEIHGGSINVFGANDGYTRGRGDLRLKERRVYDLARRHAIPHVRATGKLLFPRRQIDVWLAAKSGTSTATERPPIRPRAG